MTIANINVGLCHRRVQEGKPAFFVNWSENGENNYYFSSIRSSVENKKNQLLKLSEYDNNSKSRIIN